MASKYEEIRIDIKNKIEKGELNPGDKLPTEKELCEEYKTSSITVIKALNELCHEDLLFRRRGSGTFVKDKGAVPLKKGKTLRIGVLWKTHLTLKDLFHDYFGQITQGILEGFNLSLEDTQWGDQKDGEGLTASWNAKDFSVVLEAVSEGINDYTKTPPIELINKKDYDGLITVGIVDDNYIEKLLKLNVPVIITDYLDSQFDFRADQIFTDPIPAYQSAIDYFIKQKARKIHFIGGYIGVAAPKRKMTWTAYRKAVDGKKRVDPDSYLRLGAFRQILQKEKVSISDHWIHFHHRDEITNEQIAERLFNLDEKDIPDAIICHTYEQATSIMQYFSEHGKYILAAGSTNLKRGGPAFPIIAAGKEIGMIAVDILVSKIQKPNRLALRIGVPMKFDCLQSLNPIRK